jgi:phage terminase large subunit-like protein
MSDKIALLKLLEEKERRRKNNLCFANFDMLYDWQMEFVKSTADHFESCLCAANQIGKTLTGTTIDATHLLGEYPDDWPGHKFKHPPMIWGLGYSMEKTRDLLQTAIFGRYTKDKGFDGGLIPKHKILSWESATGIPNAMRTVKVKHVAGVSTMQFWSYSQGQHAIMGDIVDLSHVDEEPRDQTIRGQLLRASINGDKGKGGKIMYTFTPENGRTDLVIQFMDTPSKDQFFMQKGWDDSPHITPEKKVRMLSQFREHERDMRTKGDPMLGHGRIYDIADDFVLCDPFEIPDHWKVICGVDFGDDHPQGIVKLAYDLEHDTVYVVNSWKARRVSANDAWGATKWAHKFPVAWPKDGLNGEKARDGSIEVKNHYRNAGFRMIHTYATWLDGGVEVEAGIYDILDRARKGKWKIFKGQPDFMDEWGLYHRDDKGQIVKVKDDLLCAARYALMMLRYAVYNKKINVKTGKRPPPIGIIGLR